MSQSYDWPNGVGVANSIPVQLGSAPVNRVVI
jgi:hypothetical protein